MGAFYAGNRVNVFDICPNYTASLLGLVNGLGAIAGIIAIFTTGILTPNVLFSNLFYYFYRNEIFLCSKKMKNGK